MTGQAHPPMGDAELRMALRGLRQDIEPGRDLWPGIAARLAAAPQAVEESEPAPRYRWLWPMATAASFLLMVAVGWQMRTAEPGLASAPVVAQANRARQPTLVQREAEHLTVQYQAALRQFGPDAVPAGWAPGLEALDRSAREIRTALRHDPDSRLLLQRLRDTYTRRLALSRRALYV